MSHEPVRWKFTETDTENALINVDVLDGKVIWASGGGLPAGPAGTVVRTIDGGKQWHDVTPPCGASEILRPIKVFDADRAVLMATVENGGPKIYRTVDGGQEWITVFVNEDPALADSVYGGLGFFDERHGIAIGDSVDGSFPKITTADNGETWTGPEWIPGALPGQRPEENEGISATGTALVTLGRRKVLFGTVAVGHPQARVFSSDDRGATWTAVDTPIPGDVGVRSLSFRNHRHALAVSGRLGSDPAEGFAARTSDGGHTWEAAGPPTGIRNSVQWISRRAAVAVGLDGSDLTMDEGQTWTRFDEATLLGVDRAGSACWAVGVGGMAARLKM
jgi:photosystem II stability/assembly factor-like uncharacterized protein